MQIQLPSLANLGLIENEATGQKWKKENQERPKPYGRPEPHGSLKGPEQEIPLPEGWYRDDEFSKELLFSITKQCLQDFEPGEFTFSGRQPRVYWDMVINDGIEPYSFQPEGVPDNSSISFFYQVNDNGRGVLVSLFETSKTTSKPSELPYLTLSVSYIEALHRVILGTTPFRPWVPSRTWFYDSLLSPVHGNSPFRPESTIGRDNADVTDLQPHMLDAVKEVIARMRAAGKRVWISRDKLSYDFLYYFKRTMTLKVYRLVRQAYQRLKEKLGDLPKLPDKTEGWVFDP